jgi:quercetin dioxygenase-like cupin family protein
MTVRRDGSRGKGLVRWVTRQNVGPREGTVDISLDGWDIGRFEKLEWVPWGTRGDARAKLLGSADGYIVALVEAEPGYSGDPHSHAYTEFLYVVDGVLRNQGQEMVAGDGYAAAVGSTHADFSTEGGATYISIFKI